MTAQRGAPMRSPAALSCRDVTVEIGQHRLLDGFALDVEGAGWAAVIGPNGAGKSTALRAIAGLVRHHGTIEIDGVALADLSARDRARRLAYVPQVPLVPPATTVHDYVLLGRTPHLGALAAESDADHEVVRDTLDRLDLSAFAGRVLDTLSGGERQRAIIARALAQRATVLLLDEPTTALDLGHQVEVLDLVDDLRRNDGVTVVCTMHDLGLAGQYADSMILLDEGRIAVAGSPGDVLDAERISHHYRTPVQVVDTAHGPVVVPVRSAFRPRG